MPLPFSPRRSIGLLVVAAGAALALLAISPLLLQRPPQVLASEWDWDRLDAALVARTPSLEALLAEAKRTLPESERATPEAKMRILYDLTARRFNLTDPPRRHTLGSNWILAILGRMHIGFSATLDPNTLLRLGSNGSCDQISYVLVRLALASGIPARHVGLVGHVVMEAWYQDQWHMYDPHMEVLPVGKDGTHYSVDRLAQDPTAVARFYASRGATGLEAMRIFSDRKNHTYMSYPPGARFVWKAEVLYHFQRLAEWLKYLVPLLMLLLGGWLLRIASRLSASTPEGKDEKLTDVSTHFPFGKNWAEYAKTIDQTRIESAVGGLVRMLGERGLQGKTFLDIGSGSGLHSLAALRLGAASVLAVDIDADSVETTREMLRRYPGATPWRADKGSVFDLGVDAGLFDVVYSWGVLHHTGAMHDAFAKTAALVSPGGLWAFAVYRRTWLCPLWRIEKRWYSRASPRAQKAASAIYVALFRAACFATGRAFKKTYIEEYKGWRGMDYYHDVHDWMGGYPYESLSPEEVDRLVSGLGFELVRKLARCRQELGLFGSGCDEYVYRRMS